MILRLVAKEVRQHARAGLGALLLAVSTYVLLLEFLLREETPTLLRAATMFTWGASPFLAAFVARRLFVLEQEQGTFQFLRSLPVRPSAIVATKYLLGLTLVLGVNLALLWTTAQLQKDHEFVPSEWVLRLSAQIAAHVFAWFGLCALMAQLGGYRYAAWIFVMLMMPSLDSVLHEPMRNLLWTAPLADDLESTRYVTPWDAVGLGAAWGLGFTVVTVALAQLRGGRLVDAAFQPMTARRRAQVSAGLFVGLLGLELLTGLTRAPAAAPVSPALTNTRVVTTERLLEPLGARVAAAVVDLERRFALGPLPKVMLRLRRDHRPERVLTTLSADRLIIAVRTSTPSAAMLREVLTDVLMGQTAMQLERAPATGVWALGLAPFALEDPTLGPTAARLGALPNEHLEDYFALRAAVGRRGVQAAGQIAWQVVAELGGQEAVTDLAQDLFGARSGTGAGLIAARALSPRDLLEDAGVTWPDLLANWRSRVEAAARAHPDAAPWDPLPVNLRTRTGRVEALAWDSVPANPERSVVELYWGTAMNLAPQPVPARIHGSHRVQTQSGLHDLWADPRKRIVYTWVIDDEVLGWAEVGRP